MPPLIERWKAALGVLLAILASAGVTVAITTSDTGDGHHSTTVSVTARNGPKVEAPASSVAQVARSTPEKGLGAETGVTPKVLERQDAAANPNTPRITRGPPLASAHQAGCLTRAIPANWSYRTGVRPSLVVLHYTVSPNRAGWSDVNSIVAFFSRSAVQASSNYVIDAEGHCVLMVPESEKAWAQAGFNSATACSIEVINTGSESTYVGSRSGPGEKKLAQVVHDCEGRWHIPNRRGAVSGCVPTRSGVVDHYTLGGCGGGHHDVHPFTSAVAAVIADAGSSSISAGQKRRCQELNRRRAAAKKSGRWSSSSLRRANAIKAGEKKSGLVCRFGPPGSLKRA